MLEAVEQSEEPMRAGTQGWWGGEGALGGTDASGRQKSMWAQKQEGHRLAGGRMQLKRKKVVLKQIQL